MKLYLRYTATLLLGLLALSCSRDEKEKDSALEAFTMTVTLPEDTAETDAVYIVGAFNGGEEFALGNPRWELKGTATVRTVEIDPAQFIGGWTLADGYCFQSPTRGQELAADGLPIIRGTVEKNCTVAAWSKEAGPSFDPSGTWTVVGTVNSWDQKAGIAMEAEGTARIARSVTLGAKDEFKFVMDASWETNFGAGAPDTKYAAKENEEFELQPDGGNITAPAGTYDIYLYPFEAKAKIVKAGAVPPQPEHPVTGISVDPVSLTLLVGETASLKATVTPAEAECTLVWDSSAPAIASVSQSGLVTALATGTARITVAAEGFTATCDVTVDTNAPGPDPNQGPTVYVYNGTGIDGIYLYAWAEDVGSIGGAEWPGVRAVGTEEIYDNLYLVYELSDAYSAGPINLIFNYGDAWQAPDYTITMSSGGTYFLQVSLSGVSVIEDPITFDPGSGPEPGETYTLYAYDGNGWGSMNVWIWSDYGNAFESWPGLAAEGTETVSGHTFFKFTVDAAFTGSNLGVIFSSGGNQTADHFFAFEAGGKYYFNVTGTSIEVIDPEDFTPGEPPVQDNAWGIAGTMNGWSAVSPLAMEVSGDSYVARGVTLAADTKFKFVQNKSWTVNRGGTFVVVNQDFAVYQDGADIVPGLTGTYDIYIKADGSTACIVAQ